MNIILFIACTNKSTDFPYLGPSTDTFEVDSGLEVDSGILVLDSANPSEETGIETIEPGIEFTKAYFKSTHNSYSGDERGSIQQQLDAGFRGLEFDIHDNDFMAVGDYRLGHYFHGSEVSLGNGNPQTPLLTDWLSQVSQWSQQNPNHAPITLTLDIKDDLTDNINFANGDMGRLNNILIESFGTDLFEPSILDETWPSIDELRNRILIVLSGHEESRQLYKRDRGYNPAVAINSSGKIIEVHDSGSGTLWFWTGQMTDGQIVWKRHGQYDTGQTPSIALNNDGWFVEVHQSESNPTLWSRVGYIDDNYNPIFNESEEYDDGILPTIRFVNKNGFELREIHQSQNNGQHWDWELSLNPNTATIGWGYHEQTNDQLHDKDRDESNHWIEVFTDSNQTAGNDTLLVKTLNETSRIRYPQVAFVEYQFSNASELMDSETWFAAIGSGNQEIIANWNSAGLITRQWGFSEADSEHLSSPPNFPATDYFSEEWYTVYSAAIGTTE
jgi:hypothetical protein